MDQLAIVVEGNASTKTKWTSWAFFPEWTDDGESSCSGEMRSVANKETVQTNE
jgi:hypothetical protein